MNIMMSSLERGMLGRITEKYKKKGEGKAKIQPFEIRIEKQLQSGDMSFQYDFKRRGNQTSRENYLSDNDSFVLLFMAIGIMKINNAPTGQFQRGGNTQLFFYPDRNVFNFPATAVNVSEADALRAIYNGFLAIKSNTEEVLFSEMTHRFLKTPRTQFSATTDPSYTGEEYQEMPMPIIFEGQKSNEFVLNFAPQADTVNINGDPTVTPIVLQNQLVVLHRGLIIRNASEPALLDELRSEGLAI